MPQAPFKAVFFDLDGTLVDTAPEAAEALNRTLSGFDVAPVEGRDVRSWFGRGARPFLGEALKHLRTDHDLPAEAELWPRFRDHYRDTSGEFGVLYPAVKETLYRLRCAHVKTALITNKDAFFAKRVLESQGISEFFDYRIFGDTFPSRKPDPAGMTKCLQQWGLAPHEALLVGDSEIDATTGRNAGTSVWLVSYGYTRGCSVTNTGADRVIHSLADILV